MRWRKPRVINEWQSSVLEELALSRLIANYADSLGVSELRPTKRISCEHIGAVFADAILQAGLSYNSVVRTRVERILNEFPDASTMPGLLSIIEEHGVTHFLAWNHHEKVSRFSSLLNFFEARDICSTGDLSNWLTARHSREHLLQLHGVGPKTYDYLCCLVGIDCVAIDRHVRSFANEAGVAVSEYERLKTIVSNAADLLGLSRRDFDAWIWHTVSSRNIPNTQMTFSCLTRRSHSSLDS
jgi:hypothetical protein